MSFIQRDCWQNLCFSVDDVGEMFLILYNSVDKLGRGLFFVYLVDKKKKKKEKKENIFCSAEIVVKLLLAKYLFCLFLLGLFLLAKCFTYCRFY